MKNVANTEMYLQTAVENKERATDIYSSSSTAIGFNSVARPPVSSSKTSSENKPQHSSCGNQPQPKRMKIKITSNKSFPTSAQVEASVKTSPDGPKKASMEYVSKLKTVLDGEDMKLFKSAMIEYKKHNQFPSLLPMLGSIREKLEKADILKDFKIFLKEEHKQSFLNYCR